MEFIIGGVVGLIIGWNFLPQPAWIAKLFGGSDAE